MQKYARRIEGSDALEIGDGDDVAFYESLGMTLMDVEQAYNGGWYPAGECPVEPEADIKKRELLKATSVEARLAALEDALAEIITEM